MGLFLKEKQIVPQQIYCSPAKRTRKTLKRVLKALDPSRPAVEFSENLYFGGYQAYLSAIKAVSQDIDIVMTLGHNPMTEQLIRSLSNTPVLKPIKTATIACLTSDIDSWSNIKEESCELKWITGPKDLPGKH